ncbi:hypothetical protein PIB30_043856 [Stylosanthes scabra]|uniref:Uncharacterized protein n=1 Tax=Stylosanthes scabra TaxID=79078 RepID=A0ABU6ZEE5_9FABA|nr:hypothetical protein [Stylosanthes scabra]
MHSPSRVGNVEEVYHPKKPPAMNKKCAHQVQLSKEDKDERRKNEEAKRRLKKGKGLRSSPHHVKKKKKDPTKKKVKIRKQGEDSSKEEKEEEKEKRKLELKCKSVEDLTRKLYAFEKVLHHNDAMNHHLVKDQFKWKAMARPPLLVARPHDLKLPKLFITGATARLLIDLGAPAR